MEAIKDYFREIWEEIRSHILLMSVYTVSIIYYLVKLHKFNNELSNIVTSDNPIGNSVSVMTFADGKAWWYLSGAIIFAFFAVLIMWYIISHFRYVNGYSKLTFILFILLLSISVLLIVVFINNPILRAAIIVIFGGGAIVSALSSK